MADSIIVTPIVNAITVTPQELTVNVASPGPQGIAGVVAAASPITYNSGTQTVGINQAGLTLAQSQITNLITDLAGKAALTGGNAFTGTQTTPGAGSGSTIATFNTLTGQNVLGLADSGGFGAVNATNATFYVGLQSYFYGAADYGAAINVQTKSTSTPAIILRARAAQTADLLQVQNSAAANLLWITSAGNLNAAGQIRVGTSSGLGQLSVVSTGSTTIAQVVRGAVGQTANALEIQTSDGVANTSMTAYGGISSRLGGSYPAVWSLGTGTASTKGMVIRRTASQTANLLEFQLENGNVMSRIDASGDAFFGLINSSYSTSITAGGAAIVPLTVKGAASQTAPLIEIRSSANTLLSYTLSNGDWVMPSLFNSYAGVGTGYADYQGGATSLYVRPTATTRSGAVIKGLASQTADLTQWQSSAGSVLGRIKSDGTPTFSYGTFFGQQTLSADGDAVKPLVVKGFSATQTGDLTQWQDNTGSVRIAIDATGRIMSQSSANLGGFPSGLAVLGVRTSSASTTVSILRGAASQTGSMLQFQNDTGGITANFTAPVNNVNRLNLGGTDLSATLGITVHAAGGVGQVIRAAAAQTADTLQIQNSAASVLARFDASGDLFNNRVNLGGAVFATGVYYGKLNVLQEAGGNAIAIQGRDTQSVDLMRLRMGATSTGDFITMQNSSGTNVARIDSGGNLKASNVATLNSLAQLAQANSGGVMIMGRATAQFSSPGANSAALYFRDGTNAGTLKLVVRAGAAGAETTILDNIPQ
jgi:hypothetical protein